MTADTITTERIATLSEVLCMAAYRVADILQESKDGDTTPADAAAEINEMIRNINAANQ
jgi:hypothetical protein